MHPRACLAGLVALCGIGCQPEPTLENSPLGVWRVQQIERWSSADTAVDSDPQPSQVIFTPSRYSITWIGGTNPINSYQERWTPTDAEKIQRYGEITVNAGTYETEGDSLMILRPMVARVPDFMGGMLISKYRVVGDTLWLASQDEYSFDGIQAPWVATDRRSMRKLLRVEDLRPSH